MRIRKARFALVYFLAVGLFFGARQTEGSLRLGILFIVLGEALRFWANGYVGHVKVNLRRQPGSETKIGHLITAGPYARVRHPLYLGTFLIGLGFCVLVRNPWLAVGAFAFFLAIYLKKAAEEDALIHQEWGGEFAAYRREVHAWIPRLRPYANRSGQWTWQGIEASREGKTLTWLLVVVTALYLHEEWLMEHEPFSWKHAGLLGIALFLIGLDLRAEWLRRSARRAAVSKPN